MEIKLSKEQYRSLIKVVYLGDWLANASKLYEQRDKEIEDIAEYIYSHANEFEIRDLSSYDKESNKTFPAVKLEEMLHEKFVDEYDNDVFREELISRLAERDFVNKYTEEEISEMDPFERMSKIGEIEEKYEEEIVENELKNITVKFDKD